MDALRYLAYQLEWYDLLDILLVTSIVVWLYSWVRGTRAFRVLLGLGLVILIYMWARAWNLFLTEWVIQGVVQVLIIFIIIIFAPEIRQVLERLNPLRIWNRPDTTRPHDYVSEVVDALHHMARHRIGALLVFERSDTLDDLIRPGVPVGGEIRQQTLISYFQKNSPTHDGAALIRNGTLQQVGVFLPISDRDHPKQFGSRHRAALGISEVSDALVLIVSEERGDISVVEDGSLWTPKEAEKLPSEIRERLEVDSGYVGPTWQQILVKDWKVKLACLLGVAVVWFTMAGQQEIERVYSVEIQTYNLPSQFRLETMPVSRANVTLSGTRLAIARIRPEALKVLVDLSGVSERTENVPINPNRILTPPNVIVTRVDPQSLAVEVVERETESG